MFYKAQRSPDQASVLPSTGLDEEQQGRVIDAMEERRVAAGEAVIQ